MLIYRYHGLIMCYSHSMIFLVRNIHVINKLPYSDHLPMFVLFDIDIHINVSTQMSADNV